jgi:hypothetical protein
MPTINNTAAMTIEDIAIMNSVSIRMGVKCPACLYDVTITDMARRRDEIEMLSNERGKLRDGWRRDGYGKLRPLSQTHC